MLLQECYKCGAMMDEDKQPVIPLVVNENGKALVKTFCQRCSEIVTSDLNNSNLLLG